MKDNKVIKLIGSILGAFLLIAFTLGVSYAFFIYTGEGSTANVVTAGTITFSYSDATAKGNGINLVNELPRTDTEGKALMGDNNVFNFVINGNSTANFINYEIVVKRQKDSTLGSDRVKIYLTSLSSGSETPSTKTFVNNEVLKYSELSETTLINKSGKTVYTENIPKGNAEYRKEFRLRMWISDDTDMGLPENHYKTFKVKVYVYANVGVKENVQQLLSDALVKNLGVNGTTYEADNGVTYIRSAEYNTAPHLVNNYVWWSGMMWRIYAINPDGSMKIITDDNISSLPFHNDSNVYATSYMKEWLETYFYPKLNSSKDTVLKQNNDFCIDSTNDYDSARTTCINKLSNLKVGFLTVDEYNIVKNGGNTNYLINGTVYWLMTPWTIDTFREWHAHFGWYNVEILSIGARADEGVRPVTVFASASTISGGNGTLGTPYKITGDTAPAVPGTKLNLRHTGEFISYDNKLWRIMEVENGLTKVIYDGAAKLIPDAAFGKDNLDWGAMKIKLDGIGISTAKIAQNQTWQRGYMDGGNNVLTTSLGAGNPVVSTFGLPKAGEMWASQNNNKTADYAKFTAQCYWLMTPDTSGASSEWYARSDGYASGDGVGSANGARLVFFFASASTISSGNGTPNSPYILQ